MKYACSKDARLKDQLALHQGASMIAIFDYGAGNLRSVENTLGRAGRRVHPGPRCRRLARGLQDHPARRGPLRPDDARARCARRARDAPRAHPRRRAVPGHLPRPAGPVRDQRGGPGGPRPGPLRGTVRRFPLDARVPHMGWNELDVRRDSRSCCAASPSRPFVYFAHSYYVPENPRAAATCTYACPTPRCSRPATSSACSSIPRNPARWA